MLSSVVHNFRAQISRPPCPQRGAQKHEQRASRDHDSRERCGIPAAARYRWRNQMAKCDDERSVIKNGKQKSYQINRADDPEPFFELEPTRAHACICNGGCGQLQSCDQRFGGEQVAPFQSDETTNRLPSLSLNIA